MIVKTKDYSKSLKNNHLQSHQPPTLTTQLQRMISHMTEHGFTRTGQAVVKSEKSLFDPKLISGATPTLLIGLWLTFPQN